MRSTFIPILGIMWILSSCAMGASQVDPLPGSPWDWQDPDLIVCNHQNSLTVFNGLTGKLVSRVTFPTYFSNWDNDRNNYYCISEPPNGGPPANIAVIDSNTGALVSRIKTSNLGIDKIKYFEGKLYLSYAVNFKGAEDDEQEVSVYDLDAGTERIGYARGVDWGFFEIGGRVYNLRKSINSKKDFLYDPIEGSYVMELPYNVTTIAESEDKLYCPVFFDLGLTFNADENYTTLFVYDWKTKGLLDNHYTSRNPKSILEIQNTGMYLALAAVNDNGLIILDSEYREIYRSAKATWPMRSKFTFSGKYARLIDDGSEGKYDIFDISKLPVVTQVVAGGKIP